MIQAQPGSGCGGSDAFSGVTANPAVGFCTDLLVRAGTTVMFSEVTEVRDGIDQLTSRATSPEVAEAMIREMAWYDNYLDKGRVDRSANTTPGNKKGGLSNIVEKAMGAIVKSGIHRSRASWPAAARRLGPSSGSCTTRWFFQPGAGDLRKAGPRRRRSQA